jgi:(1->4)-alpha-D-glucan 1-alpha-D-glucosylmutase
LEDTALYAYYPLLSLNEVGGSPEPSTIMLRENFYEFLRERQKHWPANLNATSTHDTKRSEDVRARLNVLSEVPEVWIKEITAWSAENEGYKQAVDGRKVPDANEEYLIYQTLVGLWPADPSELPSISARLQAYVIKAIREAMVHTRWTEPNTGHEQAVCRFIERILAPQENAPFLSNVAHFLRKIVYSGMLNGISQTLLKITCPGVPDFYQGSELWDFHLVDPDNRGPVDFRIPSEALQRIADGARANSAGIAHELLAHWPDGRVKLYVIWKALGCRREHPALFNEGEFLPVEVIGDRSEHIISFLRRREEDQILVIIPRWVANFTIGNAPAFQEFLKGTHLKLPLASPQSWRNVFTESTFDAMPEGGNRTMTVGKLLSDFPIALLTANTKFAE